MQRLPGAYKDAIQKIGHSVLIMQGLNMALDLLYPFGVGEKSCITLPILLPLTYPVAVEV